MKGDNLLCFSGNAYNAAERTVAAGYDNGDIKLFDLKNMSLRWETNVKNGVSCEVQNKTKQNKTKQNKTKQNKTKQNKTKQNKAYYDCYYDTS